MKFSVEITEDAKQDILDAVLYYQKISRLLGERFYLELMNSLAVIEENPTYFSYYNSRFRRLLLNHFPYLIIYKIYKQVVIITGVVFAKQNPERIKQRSKG